MSLVSDQHLINAIVDELCSYLGALDRGLDLKSAELRRQIGDIKANWFDYIMENQLGTKILACFTAARDLNVDLITVALVRDKILTMRPKDLISSLIVQATIIYCLTTESIIISNMEFKSRDQIEAMIDRMQVPFNIARDLASDGMDPNSYQAITRLAGALMKFLADSARPLPRMISIELPNSMTALSVAFYLYADTERWEEIVQENAIVHPAFSPRQIKGLSA